MKKILLALFLLAAIGGKGQYISNDRWALFYYPHEFYSIIDGVMMGGSLTVWRSIDERQDTALSLVVEYVKRLWTDAANNDMKHSFKEILLRERLDSLISKSEDERVRLFNIKMEKALFNRLDRRIDSLQHRLDSLEKREWQINGGLYLHDSLVMPINARTLTDKEKGIVPMVTQKKGGNK